MREKLFSVSVTAEQLETIITALRFELEEIRSSDHARKLLQSALDAVNAAIPTN